MILSESKSSIFYISSGGEGEEISDFRNAGRIFGIFILKINKIFFFFVQLIILRYTIDIWTDRNRKK